MTILQLLTAHSVVGLLVTLGLITLDAVIGILRAFGTSTFTLQKLGQVVETHVLPQLGGLLVTAVTAYFAQQLLGNIWGTSVDVLFWGFVVFVNFQLLHDIAAKFGLKLPSTPTTAAPKGS